MSGARCGFDLNARRPIEKQAHWACSKSRLPPQRALSARARHSRTFADAQVQRVARCAPQRVDALGELRAQRVVPARARALALASASREGVEVS